jgi:hypothetical protein
MGRMGLVVLLGLTAVLRLVGVQRLIGVRLRGMRLLGLVRAGAWPGLVVTEPVAWLAVWLVRRRSLLRCGR